MVRSLRVDGTILLLGVLVLRKGQLFPYHRPSATGLGPLPIADRGIRYYCTLATGQRIETAKHSGTDRVFVCGVTLPTPDDLRGHDKSGIYLVCCSVPFGGRKLHPVGADDAYRASALCVPAGEPPHSGGQNQTLVFLPPGS